MKRFSFPLERVLEFRRQLAELEEARLHALAAARRQLLAQAVEMAKQSRLVRVEATARTAITSLELQSSYEYARALERSRQSTLDRAEQLERQRLDQLTRVLGARRDTRLLELLRAKRLRGHVRLADREAEAIAGDLYLAGLRGKTAGTPR